MQFYCNFASNFGRDISVPLELFTKFKLQQIFYFKDWLTTNGYLKMFDMYDINTGSIFQGVGLNHITISHIVYRIHFESSRY